MTTIAIPAGMPQYDDVPRFDVAQVRADFPILDREINGHPLVYLDSANTSHKPRQVLDVLDEHYARHNANVSRSVHTLGTEATEAYEGARAKIAAFINAPSADEVVFTKNSTEAINLVAYAFSNASLRPDADPRFRLGPGDEVVISEMEHHSNIVPWQLLCERTGATLRWFPVTDQRPAGRVRPGRPGQRADEDRLAGAHVQHPRHGQRHLPDHRSGSARSGALLLLDCSQSVPHLPIDVVDLDADFIVFTGHKMCGPTGIGVLWGRGELLAAMPPVLGGGSMIETVTMARLDVRARRRPGSRRAPRRSPRRSRSARRSTTSPASACGPSSGTRRS